MNFFIFQFIPPFLGFINKNQGMKTSHPDSYLTLPAIDEN